MNITGVETIVVGVDDLGATCRFLDEYGLQKVVGGSRGASYEALDGSGVEVRMLTDDALPAANVNGPTLRMAIWGVKDADGLEAVGAELSKDRQVARDSDGLLRSVDDDGQAIGFRVSRRHGYEAKPSMANVIGLPPTRPVNSRVDFDHHEPARALGHLVYWSDDPERSMRFYEDRLGFRVTERIKENRGIFGRAAGHPEHHSLFFLGSNFLGDRKPPNSFQHVEFGFRDVQDIMIGGHRLLKAGFETGYGPGRFELGSNWYWYFNTPMGGAFELGADMDLVDDDWRPGLWDSLEGVAGWTIAFNRERSRP